MPHYYVKHPNIDISATVDAPSTEKARTTFLDYLERTGKVERSSRQYLRRNMIAEKLRGEGEVLSDVDLEYDYIEEEKPVFMEPAPIPEVEEEMFVPEEESPIEEQSPTPQGLAAMPIQQLALRSKV